MQETMTCKVLNQKENKIRTKIKKNVLKHWFLLNV